MFEELGDRANIAGTLHQLAMLQQDQGNYPEALRLYRQSLETFEELGDRVHIAATMHQIGTVLEGRREHKAALMNFACGCNVF